MMTPITAPVLLTVEQVAERMNCKPRFVRRLIAERRIEFHKVGRHVRISEPALAEFVKASRIPPLEASVTWRQNRRIA
jgi:excisionase family DNA binding protein